MTRWLTIVLVSAGTTAAFSFGGTLKVSSDGIWMCLLFLLLLFGFSRVWRLPDDRSLTR